jgi:hypothetical protein
MSDRVARPRYAAHRRVLGRADSSAIGAPCVLALHSPIAPARRASFWFDLLDIAGDGTPGAEAEREQHPDAGQRDRRSARITENG